MFFTAVGKVELRGWYSFLFPSFKFEMKLFYSKGRVFLKSGLAEAINKYAVVIHVYLERNNLDVFHT